MRALAPPDRAVGVDDFRQLDGEARAVAAAGLCVRPHGLLVEERLAGAQALPASVADAENLLAGRGVYEDEVDRDRLDGKRADVRHPDGGATPEVSPGAGSEHAPAPAPI